MFLDVPGMEVHRWFVPRILLQVDSMVDRPFPLGIVLVCAGFRLDCWLSFPILSGVRIEQKDAYLLKFEI